MTFSTLFHVRLLVGNVMYAICPHLSDQRRFQLEAVPVVHFHLQSLIRSLSDE